MSAKLVALSAGVCRLGSALPRERAADAGSDRRQQRPSADLRAAPGGGLRGYLCNGVK